MNPTTTTDTLPPPPPPLQPPRSSFSCDRHPDENFSGFCTLCLCERLVTLDQSANSSSSSRRNSSATAIKSFFKPPELRRTKSFSASKHEGFGFSAGFFEPQRKSCDVRGRSNALCSLFSINDVNKPRRSSVQQLALGNTSIVVETSKEDDDEAEEDLLNEEIEVSAEQKEPNVNDSENITVEIAEIEELIEEPEDVILDELKTMQDHLDFDSQSKKPSRSNFWSAASVLSKKWQKWKRKQKSSNVYGNGVVSSSTLPVEKPISRQYRETKSEIADYGFGRRSCDIDPRFSLDAGRISFDEPRASWDGYVIGRTFPRLPPMVEDAPVVPIPRSDTQISVEQPPANSHEVIPGGSIQTKEYYTDSSSKRRKSLDRSNSIRKMAAAVVAEMDDTNHTITNTAVAPAANAKVSPATTDYNHGNGRARFRSIGGERELSRDSNSNSFRDDCSETFELGNERDHEKKKKRRWRWKLWGLGLGLIHRNGGSKDEEEDRFSRVNGVERSTSYSESWKQSGININMNNNINNRLFRSNSTVSWRDSSKKSSSEINGFGSGKNRRFGEDEFVVERNSSGRYSPNHADSGLLRFYLTPLRGSRRNKPIVNSNPGSRNGSRFY